MKAKKIILITACVIASIVFLTKQFSLNNSMQSPEVHKTMDEATFWNIISKFNWHEEDENLVMKPAVDILSQFPIDDIYKFDDILSEKLYLLDTKEFGSNFMRGAAQYLSVDMFLYRRCYVVAKGRVFFDGIIANPKQGPFEETFEGMLFLASTAYAQKTNARDYAHVPTYNYETYSNSRAWDE